MKGWLDGETWPKALEYANACGGAFAVSRHGCTPAYPSLAELQFFLKRGVTQPDLRNDAALEQIHWSTNRTRRGLPDWADYRIFAFDHRMQLEVMDGYTLEKGSAFKELCMKAALQVQDGARATAFVRQSDRQAGTARSLGQRTLDWAPSGVAGLAPAELGTRDRCRLRRARGLGARERGEGSVLLPP